MILVHGLARTKYSMRKVQKFLERREYIVLNFNYPSTKVQGMKDFLLVHKPHTFIMRDKAVLTQIDHFLRTGMFRRESDA